jgi:hypothetical protein
VEPATEKVMSLTIFMDVASALAAMDKEQRKRKGITPFG